MSDQNQINQLIQLIAAQNSILAAIAEQLQEMVQLQRQGLTSEDGPNYRRQLSEYASFDWFSINATPTREVGDGINEVSWGGYTWWRRSGTGKFGNAIWFSRSIGRNEDNTPKYARLITFKDSDAPEPLQVPTNNINHPPAPNPASMTTQELVNLPVMPNRPINPNAQDEYRDYKDQPRPMPQNQTWYNPDGSTYEAPAPRNPAIDPISRDQEEYERYQLQEPPLPPSTGHPPMDKENDDEMPDWLKSDPPMPEAQAIAPSPQQEIDPKEAEETFYQLVKPAIRSGQVSVTIINEYAAAAKEVGWPRVLEQLQEDIAAVA